MASQKNILSISYKIKLVENIKVHKIIILAKLLNKAIKFSSCNAYILRLHNSIKHKFVNFKQTLNNKILLAFTQY